MKKTLILLIVLTTSLFGEAVVFEDVMLGSKKNRDDLEREQVIERSLDLEDRLNQMVIGQEEAVKVTADAIIRYAAGVNDPNGPIATLLYCGPSGVGKTELAKQLAKALYDDENRLVRINMAEYGLEHSVQRLIGSPPGYVNHEQGGQLTNALKQNPYAVVLLDEVEKAHPRVMRVFLELFDEGQISSSKGERINCRKSIFILTSNICALDIARYVEQGLNSQQILEMIQPELMEQLSVELYNRMDPVVFKSLSWRVKGSIVHKMLNELSARIAHSKRLYVEYDKSVIEYLVDYGFDPLLGARPVKRMIEKNLTPLIAKAIIRGRYQAGDRLKVFLVGNDLIIDKMN
ncbi:MAG: AAA family ATPase [Chlamydiales bacterium]